MRRPPSLSGRLEKTWAGKVKDYDKSIKGLSMTGKIQLRITAHFKSNLFI
ncbi:MAG: hypothetical protein ACP5QI_03465 [Candidatus Bathyarchaeia archaeon]